MRPRKGAGQGLASDLLILSAAFGVLLLLLVAIVTLFTHGAGEGDEVVLEMQGEAASAPVAAPRVEPEARETTAAEPPVDQSATPSAEVVSRGPPSTARIPDLSLEHARAPERVAVEVNAHPVGTEQQDSAIPLDEALEPPTDLNGLIEAYALGYHAAWEPLQTLLGARMQVDLAARYPAPLEGSDLAVRRAGGLVVRGRYAGTSDGALRLRSGDQERKVPLAELGLDLRLRLDPALRDEVADIYAARYLFSRLPAQSRVPDPGPAASQAALREAALRGSADAARRLAARWMDDIGGRPDPARAFAWYRLAAGWGDAEAQHGLARLYFDGRGTEPDEALATAWMERAAAQGHEPSRRFLENESQRRALSRRAEQQGLRALEQQMMREGQWLEEAARSPSHVTIFSRGRDGVTIGADPAAPSP